MTILLGIDDTDNENSRGTGRLARAVAMKIGSKFPVYGVTRHQLYVHPEIPYTSHNSCAVIHINLSDKSHINEIFQIAKREMLHDFVEGSDPGLSAAKLEQISPSLVAFGKDAKNSVLTQEKARNMAENLDIRLEGLGGTEDGVIGAMAGLGLASTSNDGRFLQIGSIRELLGSQPAEKLLESGVEEIFTLDGRPIDSGLIYNEPDKSVKPCPVNGRTILFVEEKKGKLVAVKRD